MFLDFSVHGTHDKEKTLSQLKSVSQSLFLCLRSTHAGATPKSSFKS